MVDLKTLLSVLPVVGAVTARAVEFKALFDQVVATFSEDDQAVAKDAYSDLMQDNDEGFARLDAKLAAAEKRT